MAVQLCDFHSLHCFRRLWEVKGLRHYTDRDSSLGSNTFQLCDFSPWPCFGFVFIALNTSSFWAVVRIQWDNVCSRFLSVPPGIYPSALPHVTFILHTSYVFVIHSLEGERWRTHHSRMSHPCLYCTRWKSHMFSFYWGIPRALPPSAPLFPFLSMARCVRSPRKHILYPKHQHTLFPLNSRIKGKQTSKPKKPILCASWEDLGCLWNAWMWALHSSFSRLTGALRASVISLLLQDTAPCLQKPFPFLS